MTTAAVETHVTLKADTNQALGLATYAIDFLGNDPERGGHPADSVLRKTNQFLTDSVICGLSALALGTNAPTVLRDEALTYPTTDATPLLGKAINKGATAFGSATEVHPEKAIVANCAAVREWDSNGTNFGYNPELGHTAGEFGHNDFYAVALAAAQMTGKDGAAALKAMVLHDEIRGRLAEVFSLKTYKVDHVVHGAIASACVYGAMLGATPEQIESAIGMVIAHAIPFRAIRAGKQLSDSKGSSAAISTEFAVLCMRRSMQGFMGPRDIFRNPEAIFRIFEGPGQMFHATGKPEANTANADRSPFDLVLGLNGDDFAVMGMHFKLGLYEHQSAGAIQAVIDLINKAPHVLDQADGSGIQKIKIVAYEPAFGIIGDPAKKDPRTRQSADHSMAFIVSALLRKALEHTKSGADLGWHDLILVPEDFSERSIFNEKIRSLMAKIDFEHGGPDYDSRYPDGIPTSVVITGTDGTDYGSGLVMYPAGHARNTTADLDALLDNKFRVLGALAFEDPQPVIDRYQDLGSKSSADIRDINSYDIVVRGRFE